MSELGRDGGQSGGDRAGEADFDNLESSFFDTGAGIERGEVSPPDEHAAHDARTTAWRRRAGLAAGACVALAIGAMLLLSGGDPEVVTGEQGSGDQATLAQSPDR
jgi:ferric-dicitrate binding protein FerR (iron transport regulator)